MDRTRFSPLRQAVWRGDASDVRKLLVQRADPNDVSDVADGGWSVLESAVEEGRPAIVEVLLEHGADPNSSSGGQTTLTHAVDSACTYASESGFFHPDHLRIVGLLLEFGAYPAEANIDGTTPIDEARCRGMALLENLALELQRWA